VKDWTMRKLVLPLLNVFHADSIAIAEFCLPACLIPGFPEIDD